MFVSDIVAAIEAEGVPEEEQRERFRIETKDQAMWALRKMSVLKKKQAENTQAAQVEIDRLQAEIDDIQAWCDEENKELEHDINFFEYLLQEYFMQLRQEDPKLKTINLPHGSLKMRKQQPEYLYDETLLLPWAKENLPEAVVVKESVAKTPVKKYIQETGEIVPGVEIIERPEKFSVEVK